ncbi:diguanylate cyclase domain-containing protein [Zoogloea sp.]|uniref:diguanylate cyclase domain-containing protein n=1 Tax=Zoogloea sp. TaxID=49181 RepID=UPI0035B0BFAD
MAHALEKVSLQLKWSHAFQFAGYYAALEKGYYREAGLDVQLREATPGVDPLQAVLTDQAQYGVGTSSLLLARKSGKPVVVLAVIFQHSPLVLIAREDSGTQAIHDIVGKRVMIEPQSDELFAYLKQEGITLDRLVQLPHSFNPEDLIEGRVDAISAYVSNEPYYLDRAKFDYQVYTPRAGGIDFYGDNLFTTEQELKAHPERVRAFREASLRGWQYAMQHPEEIVDLLLAKYSTQHPRDFYLFEAQRMASLMRTDLVEVGYMNRGRWRHIANTYADLGLLPGNYALNGFLYEPAAPHDPTTLYIALSLLAGVSAIAMYIYRINHRLRLALCESREAEGRIRHLAQHDPLTDLPNRALFSDRLEQALVNAKRDGQQLAVIFMDLDDFKQINDNLGHGIGDCLLQQVAIRLRHSLRESDTVARVGGDEFILLLRNITDAPDALAVAQKLCSALARPFEIDRHLINISASIGIALYPEHGLGSIELLKHADEAMYEAKRAGRNRVQVFAQA